MKNIVVIFGHNMAYTKTNPEDLAAYRLRSDCVVNPDLRHMSGIPREYWKKVGNEIKEMNLFEKQLRDVAIASEGVSPTSPPHTLFQKCAPLAKLILKPALLMLAGAGITLLLQAFL